MNKKLISNKKRHENPIGTSIEIECLSVNNKIEKIVVYYGSISKVPFIFFVVIITKNKKNS